ncbi:IS110 family transposase [Phenylobacterium sp.]|uniref:IS110 family transposase n=1 Tax=Phenylobacterium sp. TaxID=1871053 RepID=UPI00289DD559|nr:IS110 family transposase [Phenylobacterium sp.]
MPYFVGLDVSKNTTSICVVDTDGQVIEELTVETTPRALVEALRGKRRRYRRIGMEAGDMASWLNEGLTKAGLPIICIDPRHAHTVLAARHNKTDRNDALGIAELMRIGSYKLAHMRSHESQEIRALLVARDMLVAKRRSLDSVIRAILLGLGLKIPRYATRTFVERVAAIVAKYPAAARSVGPLLRVRSVLVAECEAYDHQVDQFAMSDPVCRRLVTAPGIGNLCALAFRAAVDEPRRFPNSRAVGAHFGLTPKTYQSGEKTSQGRITHAGDPVIRKLLYLAACNLSRPGRRESPLSRWAKALLQRMRFKKAMVAVARKLAIVLHRMWIDDTDFRWEYESADALPTPS